MINSLFGRSEQQRRQQEQEGQEREQLRQDDTTQQHTAYHGGSQYQPVESHDEPDHFKPRSEPQPQSQSSVNLLYSQMVACECILWLLALGLIIVAALLVASKVPPALMAASAINVTVSAIQLVRMCTGVKFRPRSSSDARPRKWTVMYLAVMDVAWVVAFVLMFSMYELQGKKEREEDEYDFDIDVDIDEITRKYLAKRRGGGGGGRGGGGGGGRGGSSSSIPSYDAGEVPPGAFYACAGLGVAILYVPLSFSLLYRRERLEPWLIFIPICSVISLWQWLCVYFLYKNRYSPEEVAAGDKTMKQATKVTLVNPFTNQEYELKRTQK